MTKVSIRSLGRGRSVGTWESREVYEGYISSMNQSLKGRNRVGAGRGVKRISEWIWRKQQRVG